MLNWGVRTNQEYSVLVRVQLSPPRLLTFTYMQLEKTFTDSKIISAISYMPAREEMFVTFKTGKRYVYFFVHEKTYQQALEAESIGEWFSQNIKNQYSYKLIN
jgi:hypothetical protein